MQLPEDILWEIWTYAGPKSYFLDKGLLSIISNKKQTFFERPLRIHYTLLRWKRKGVFSERTPIHIGRTSRYSESPRYLDIKNCSLGHINNDHTLNVSQQLADKLIPLSFIYETSNVSKLSLTYWTIISVWTIDIRTKLYSRLWPSWKQARLETS